MNEDFAQSLRAHLVAQTTELWMFWYGLLESFVKENGHCRVTALYKTDDGFRLGFWVSNQRQAKDTMEPDRRLRLEMLPNWSWDVLSDWWEEGFSHLKDFAERERHCRVPDKTEDGYRLRQWLMVQRSSKEKMDFDRRQRLEALPGWSWDARSHKWEAGFFHLKEFSERERHCRVPITYKSDDGYRLGSWVNNQRVTKDKMNTDRRQRLEALPGWSWNVFLDKWEEGFSHLKEFSERERHCRVPYTYKTEDDYRLGQWVRLQRSSKDEMSTDHRQRLEALPGWSWNAY